MYRNIQRVHTNSNGGGAIIRTMGHTRSRSYITSRTGTRTVPSPSRGCRLHLAAAQWILSSVGPSTPLLNFEPNYRRLQRQPYRRLHLSQFIYADPPSLTPRATTYAHTESPSLHTSGRWLFLADMHFDFPRLDRLDSTCQWILSEVRRLQPSHIFLLGDTLHTRNEVHVEASSAAARFIQQLLHMEYTSTDGKSSRPPPHVHLLVGNHDMHHVSSRAVTSLDSFAVHDSSVTETPSSNGLMQPPSFVSSLLTASSLSRLHMYRDISFVDIDGQQVLFIPYHHGDDCKQVEDYIAVLSKQHDLSKIVCLAHLPLTGATISGISGLDPNRGHKYSHSSVSLTTMSQFQRTFLGHFHIHQLVGRSGRVLYCGAPMQFNYGDANDGKKGFILYEPGAESSSSKAVPWQLYQNPFGQHYFSRTLAQLQAEVNAAADSNISKSSPPTSPYTNKCVQIEVPADRDTIQHEREIEQVKKWLKEQQIEDLKIKQLKAPSSSAANQKKVLTDSHNVDASDAAVSTASVTTPATDSLLVDIVNGDLGPLVEKYLEQDHELSAENRTIYRQVMQGMLQQIAHTTPSAPAGLVTSASSDAAKKFFHAQLHRLEISNFLSVQGSLTFDFSALKPGIWYISGRNGTGKSLLLEALTWTLFGKTLRGHEPDRITRVNTGLSQDELVNDVMKRVNPHAQVRVSLTFANGVTITRSHTHGVAGSTVRIETPSGPVEPKSSKKLDEEAVVNLLGINFDRFVSSVLLSSTTKNFISAKPEEKRKIIEELLGFTQFENLHAECKEKRLEELSEKKTLEGQLDRDQEKLDTWKKRLSDLTKTQATKTEEFTKLQTELKTSLATSAASEAQQRQLDEAEKATTTKRETQAKEVTRIQQELDHLRQNESHQQAIELRKQKSTAEANLAAVIKQSLERLYQAQNSCNQRLNASAKQADEGRLREMATLQRQISTLSQISQLRLQLDLARQKVTTLQTPTWIQTIEKVLVILLQWASSIIPEPYRERLRVEVIQPLQEVVQQQRNQNGSKQSEALHAAEFHVLELQNELDTLTDGKSNVEEELKEFSALKKKQQDLLKQSSSTAPSTSASKAAVEEQQKDDPAFIELQSIKSEIQRLEDPSKCDDPQVKEKWTTVARVNSTLNALDASLADQRTRGTSLQSQRKEAEKLLTQLTQSEATARQKLRQHETDRAKSEVQRGKKEKEVELAQEYLVKLEKDLTALKEDGPKFETTLRETKAKLDETTANFAALAYWLDRVSDAPTKQEDGFRSFCIQRVLGLLNPLLEANLEMFSSDETGAVSHPLACQLTSELNLVASPGATSMEKRSEGQRKRTHLALFLALFTLSQRRSSFLNQFLFLDEAFDSLDQDGQKAVNLWIQQYAQGTTNDNSSDMVRDEDAPSAPIASSSAQPLVFVITHSSYTNPSVSNGCIHVRVDPVTRGSIYRLETAGNSSKSDRTFVQQSPPSLATTPTYSDLINDEDDSFVFPVAARSRKNIAKSTSVPIAPTTIAKRVKKSTTRA